VSFDISFALVIGDVHIVLILYLQMLVMCVYPLL
jgi:hypothetical protein